MMNTRTIVTVLGAGCVLLACGGAPSDSTGSAANDLNAHASQHGPGDAGGGGGNASGHGNSGGQAGGGGQGAKGHACKPVDGGRSPCARGSGDDGDGGDVDNGDMDDDDADDNGGHGHGHSRDAGGGD